MNEFFFQISAHWSFLHYASVSVEKKKSSNCFPENRKVIFLIIDYFKLLRFEYKSLSRGNVLNAWSPQGNATER